MSHFEPHLQGNSWTSGVGGNMNKLNLPELMRLASQFHLGRISQGDMSAVLDLIKERACEEIDVGDGMKMETVRVERKLDGSVMIFFGF